MPYRAPMKVRFSDIDRAGIVYYPRFFHYFHVAMEEFFGEALGKDYAKVLETERFGLPTVHLETDFRRPLRYGDHIEVEVVVRAIGRTSVTWTYTVYRRGEDEPVAACTSVTVCLDLDRYEKRDLPAWLRTALEQHRVS